jgi:HK97 family phage portal protein
MPEEAATRRRWWYRKTEDRTLTKQNVPPVLWSAAPGDTSVTPSNALTCADAYACVRALADAAASLPLHVYRRRGDGRERVDNPTARLLNNPAPSVTQSGLIGQIVAHLNLWGNAFVGKYKRGDVIDQLWCLPPSNVTVELKSGQPTYTYVDPTLGTRSMLTTSDVVHIKALSTDGLVGLSPVKQCRMALGLSSQLVEHASRFFESDARPSGVLKVPQGPLVEDQIQNLKTAWENRHAGLKASHRIAVLAGDVEFQAIGMAPEDAQFLQQRQLSAQEVARIFRVPPHIIGAPVTDSLTYSTVEQQNLAFVTHSLRPHLIAVEQALSADRDLFEPNTYTEFLVDAILRGDAESRWRVYDTAIRLGAMTIDECRARENLPALPAQRVPVPTPSTNGNGAKPQPAGVA